MKNKNELTDSAEKNTFDSFEEEIFNRYHPEDTEIIDEYGQIVETIKTISTPPNFYGSFKLYEYRYEKKPNIIIYKTYMHCESGALVIDENSPDTDGILMQVSRSEKYRAWLLLHYKKFNLPIFLEVCFNDSDFSACLEKATSKMWEDLPHGDSFGGKFGIISAMRIKELERLLEMYFLMFRKMNSLYYYSHEIDFNLKEIEFNTLPPPSEFMENDTDSFTITCNIHHNLDFMQHNYEGAHIMINLINGETCSF